MWLRQSSNARGLWTLLMHESGGPVICGPVVPKTCGFQEILWSDGDYQHIVTACNAYDADQARIERLEQEQRVAWGTVEKQTQRIAELEKALQSCVDLIGAPTGYTRA